MGLFFLIIFTYNFSGASTTYPYLFSPAGTEMTVSFKAEYLSPFNSLTELKTAISGDPSIFTKLYIEPTLKYLFGPMTRRAWGGIRRTLNIDVHWDEAREAAGGVRIPYEYKGRWLIALPLLMEPVKMIPVPLNVGLILSNNWKKCTDSFHNEASFYWYYWDPLRIGCEQQEKIEFQNVTLSLSEETTQTQLTFPEYRKMLRNRNGQVTFPMTFAFGYFEEPEKPQPESDPDIGVREYQQFVRALKKLLPNDTIETKILRSEYPHLYDKDYALGRRFRFQKNNVAFDIRVVTNAGVDQMVLFAKSFANDHDGYFGWLGHSRVGSGFDALRFSQMLKDFPNLYSLTEDYQLVYWGGCNSYSYYTEPFFKLKSGLTPNDPNGTLALDIIANGLPSYFGLNAASALLQAKALLTWQSQPKSYQDLLNETENLAQSFGTTVLTIVLGDEDNSL